MAPVGARAVGLTGADAKIGLAVKAAPLATISGEHVDLGLVGEPGGGDVALLTDLLQLGYVPVVASVGVAADGTLLNVNADVFAAHLAAALGARRLIVAGTTPGVLDGAGATIAQLTEADVQALTASGTAHSGMVAKLNACRHALGSGVGEVAIVAGRGVEDFDEAVGTRLCGCQPGLKTRRDVATGLEAGCMGARESRVGPRTQLTVSRDTDERTSGATRCRRLRRPTTPAR